MAKVSCQLPARVCPNGSGKCVTFGVDKGDSPVKARASPEVLHQQLKAWLEVEVKGPLSSTLEKLSGIDAKIESLESKVSKCLDTLSESTSTVWGSQRQANEESPGEDYCPAGVASAGSFSRRDSRSATTPICSQQGHIGLLSSLLPLRTPARKATKPPPLKVMPEPPSSPSSDAESQPRPLLQSARSSGWLLSTGGELGPSLVSQWNMPGTLRGVEQEPRTAVRGDSICMNSASSRRSRISYRRRQSGISSSGSSGKNYSGFPVHSRVRRRATIDSMSTCTSGDSFFATRVRLTRVAARQGAMPGRIWRFLEDPESGPWAASYARLHAPFIMFSVMVTFIQTIEPAPFDPLLWATLETAIELIWLIETALRFAVCPNRKVFFLSFHNVIDAISCMPIIIRASVGFTLPRSYNEAVLGHVLFARYVLLCVVPVVRLLKILRRFETFQLLLSAFKQVLEALPVLIYTQLLLTLVFSSLIFFVEPRENITSLPSAAWLTIVTMTTVGYGDVTPASPAGSLVVSFLVVSSVIFTSFPLGIIGSTFTEVWSDRNRILLMQRTRECLDQWGYTPQDIVKLFELADRDGDDELNLEEFRNLMDHMKLGLKDERVVELFESFDYDFSGSINHQEFCRVLFPAMRREEMVKRCATRGIRDCQAPPPIPEDQQFGAGTQSGRGAAAFCSSGRTSFSSGLFRASSGGQLMTGGWSTGWSGGTANSAAGSAVGSGGAAGMCENRSATSSGASFTSGDAAAAVAAVIGSGEDVAHKQGSGDDGTACNLDVKGTGEEATATPMVSVGSKSSSAEETRVQVFCKSDESGEAGGPEAEEAEK